MIDPELPPELAEQSAISAEATLGLGGLAIGGQIHETAPIQARLMTTDEFLATSSYRAGDRITGLAETDFKAVERRICQWLQPGENVDYLLRGSDFYDEPLARALKPKGFHGRLVNSQVVLAPPDARPVDIPEVGSGTARQLIPAAGIRLAVMADLRSSGRPLVSTHRDVTYSRTIVRAVEQSPGSRVGGVSRRMSPTRQSKQADVLVLAAALDARTQAHRAQSEAVLRPASSGLGSLGKNA